MQKWLINTFVLATLALFGCEREFPVLPGEETDGYQIVGKVTDALGNPITRVSVKVYYDFQYVDDDPPPSEDFEVTNSTQVIRVNVYDSKDGIVRTLYNGTHPVGTMRVEWDKRFASGVDAPSGVYEVRYLIDGEVRKSYPVMVHETVTAVTDTAGAYTITDKHLPVGFYPVPLYSSDNSQYLGQFRITNVVFLEFITPAFTKAIVVSLNKGEVSRVNVTME